jgi:hypothetical protein
MVKDYFNTIRDEQEERERVAKEKEKQRLKKI